MPPRTKAVLDDEPFDYDLDAVIVEAETAPPFRFKWGGQVFSMRLMLGMEVRDQLALEDATVQESMEMILGDEFEQLMAVKGSDGKSMSIGRMQDLIQAWHRHQGLEPGESRASRRSSGNTARLSKRTSRSGRR